MVQKPDVGGTSNWPGRLLLIILLMLKEMFGYSENVWN